MLHARNPAAPRRYTRAVIPPRITCPRCAYDLSGSVAAWVDSCPVRGTCPECGLTYRWAHVFNPDLLRLPRFVEHAKGFRQFARWALLTWLWALLPWVFWSRVELHHRTRPWVMAAWLLFIALACRVPKAALEYFYGAATGWVSLNDWSLLNPLTVPVISIRGSFARLPKIDPMWDAWPSSACWLLTFVALFPVLLLLMPISMSRATIRPAHVLRATIFSAAWPLLYLLQELAFDIVFFVHLELTPPAQLVNAWRFYPTLEPIREWTFQIIVVGGVAWGMLWWLLALVKGWKLRHGALAWALLMFITGCICTALYGFEVTLFGHVYRF